MKDDAGLGRTKDGFTIYDVFPEYNKDYESFFGKDITKDEFEVDKEPKKSLQRKVKGKGQLKLL